VLQNWRFWVLAVLLVGPPVAYISLGAAWLAARGWILIGFLAWTTAALAFGLLSVRWTKTTRRNAIAPLDWTAPETFAPRDLDAWKVVMEEAERAEHVNMAELTSFELYMQTGVRLAERLSETYDPGAESPIEHVPVADLLTALELAAEDLNHMVREIPGGDIVTFAHGKAAVQAASFFAKANEYYNYLLPWFQPVQGILRLGSTKLLTEPAWRNMQHNVLRWFYRAYVQRLGVHLIEMYSGRLAIGAGEYRRLTGRSSGVAAPPPGAAAEDPKVRIAIAGARDAGKSTLANVLEHVRAIEPSALRDLLLRNRLDPDLASLLERTSIIETQSYGTRGDKDPFLDRVARHGAVQAAVHADLLVLVVDSRRDDFRSDGRFAQHWLDHFTKETELQRPPALVVLTGIDRLHARVPSNNEATDAEPTSDPPDPALISRRVVELQDALPAGFASKVVSVGLGNPEAPELAELLVPALASLVSRCARGALIRHLHEHASRSKAGRILMQVGKQGQRVWNRAGAEFRKRWESRKHRDPHSDPPRSEETTSR
jgi:hypothetical protein